MSIQPINVSFDFFVNYLYMYFNLITFVYEYVILLNFCLKFYCFWIEMFEYENITLYLVEKAYVYDREYLVDYVLGL